MHKGKTENPRYRKKQGSKSQQKEEESNKEKEGHTVQDKRKGKGNGIVLRQVSIDDAIGSTEGREEQKA